MTELLEKSETKTLSKAETKNIDAQETKQLGISKTRAKKIKHSYNVEDEQNSLVLKLFIIKV